MIPSPSALVAARRLRAAALAGSLAGAMLAGVLPTAAAAAAMQVPITDGSNIAAAPSSATIQLTQVASGLSKPVFITSANDGTGRLFIVEKTGTIRILENGSVLPTPLLDLSSSVSSGGEQGLLGLAFHPGFQTNRRFYVDYTNRHGNTVIREYKVSPTNPDVVQPGSARNILKIAQPYSNHNGGMIAFGPDHYLYIGTGDGGSAGDPGNRAQSTSSLLGKLLRINVNGSTARRAYKIPQSNPYVGKPGPQPDLAARPPEPVAVVVRPLNRQAVHRRRRPVSIRRDRPGEADQLRCRPWRQLGLAGHGGLPLLPALVRLQHLRQAGAAAQLLASPQWPVRGDRRLRLPWLGDPGPSRLVRVR